MAEAALQVPQLRFSNTYAHTDAAPLRSADELTAKATKLVGVMLIWAWQPLLWETSHHASDTGVGEKGRSVRPRALARMYIHTSAHIRTCNQTRHDKDQFGVVERCYWCAARHNKTATRISLLAEWSAGWRWLTDGWGLRRLRCWLALCSRSSGLVCRSPSRVCLLPAGARKRFESVVAAWRCCAAWLSVTALTRTAGRGGDSTVTWSGGEQARQSALPEVWRSATRPTRIIDPISQELLSGRWTAKYKTAIGISTHWYQ